MDLRISELNFLVLQCCCEAGGDSLKTIIIFEKLSYILPILKNRVHYAKIQILHLLSLEHEFYPIIKSLFSIRLCVDVTKPLLLQ